jgi:hypothetical protein
MALNHVLSYPREVNSIGDRMRSIKSNRYQLDCFEIMISKHS